LALTFSISAQIFALLLTAIKNLLVHGKRPQA
jgi:hypothetical protein